MIKFYLQKTDKDGVALEPARDLEKVFPGLKYLSCKGLNAEGTLKNVYTESYADHEGVRTYHPSDVGKRVYHEATDIELSLIFLSNDRQSVYKSFVEYIQEARMYWWDTARNLKAWLMLIESSEPEEDIIKGEGYIKTTFKFTNIWGKTYQCNDKGELA